MAKLKTRRQYLGDHGRKFDSIERRELAWLGIGFDGRYYTYKESLRSLFRRGQYTHG